MVYQAPAFNQELERLYISVIESWGHTLALRDRGTFAHSRRAAQIAVGFARKLGLPEPQVHHLWNGALVHDIGKISIPDVILQKPGPLNETEWVQMRKHPLYAYQMLQPLARFQPALEVPYFHHERWDGSGYPLGLRGEQIPFNARLFAIVDVWDALNTDRPYRSRRSPQAALAYILEQSGILFDPELARAFAKLITRLDSRWKRG